MKAPLCFRTARVYCALCGTYTELEGPVYGPGPTAPVHITPAVMRAHREAAHGEASPAVLVVDR